MTQLPYNCERFWFPRGTEIRLFSGYLADPDVRRGINPEGVPVAKLRDKRCLALLGEPGIGKTTVLEAEFKAAELECVGTDDGAKFFSLRGGEHQLVRHIFQNDEVLAWRHGSGRLYLFLDSLDEGLLAAKTIGEAISNELAAWKPDIERLFLRVTCRGGDWPEILEQKLKELYPGDGFGDFTLAPLRLDDVVAAAESRDFDPVEFANEVNLALANPLAARPITLKMLLDVYSKDRTLPSTQVDLYRRACEILCYESNKWRLGNRADDLGKRKRMLVAGRVAAATVFGAIGTIRCDETSNNPATRSLDQEDLEGTEEINGEQFKVDLRVLEKVLSCSLFDDRGLGLRGWAHQTYAEFMAAWYLLEKKAELPQAMSLLIHPSDSAGAVVPQLRETAAWLSAMWDDVCSRICEVDPEALLLSESVRPALSSRARLVDLLLQVEAKGAWLQSDAFYARFAHPGLGSQIAPILTARGKPPGSRMAAVGLIFACKLDEFLGQLAELALDPTEDHNVRTSAAMALANRRDQTARLSIRSLLTASGRTYQDYNLAAIAISGLWPELISASELFSILLDWPSSSRGATLYDGFLRSLLRQDFAVDDLPMALKWVAGQNHRRDMDHGLARLMDKIMLSAWNALEFPGVPEPFARAAISRLLKGDEIVGRNSPYLDEIFGVPSTAEFDELAGGHTERRRGILKLLVEEELRRSGLVSRGHLLAKDNPFLDRRDLEWILTVFGTALTSEEKIIWAEVINFICTWDDPDSISAVWDEARRDPVLRRAVHYNLFFLSSVDLDSEDATRMRQDWEEEQERSRRVQTGIAAAPSARDVVRRRLNLCEAEGSIHWLTLTFELGIEMQSPVPSTMFSAPDLAVAPGWQYAEPVTRTRIINAAMRFLLENDPETEKWRDSHRLYPAAIAGYKAFRLLLDVAVEQLNALDPSTWEKWAPALLTQGRSINPRDEAAAQKLVGMAYRASREFFLQSLTALLESGWSVALDRVKPCRDGRLSAVILSAASDSLVSPDTLSAIILWLLECDVSGSLELAVSLIPVPTPTDSEARTRAISAATVILLKAPTQAWGTVFDAIRQDHTFGTEVMARVAARNSPTEMMRLGPTHQETPFPELGEEHLEELFKWLASTFEYPADSQSGSTSGTPQSLRDEVLSKLVSKGTPEACAALQRILCRFPTVPSIQSGLRHAIELTRRNMWVPPSPRRILTLLAKKDRRIVENSDQLLEAIIESLARLRAKLQAENPAAQDLWNNPLDDEGKEVWTPKREELLSDYVKRFLDDDLGKSGVVINREVQINIRDKTDIRVEAVTASGDGKMPARAVVIVETKGCWNPKLGSEMKLQLVDRYLNEFSCTHGVYLIGSFFCERWHDSDGRKKASARRSRANLNTEFDQKAEEISQNGFHVRAFVLDLSLPPQRQQAASGGKPGETEA